MLKSIGLLSVGIIVGYYLSVLSNNTETNQRKMTDGLNKMALNTSKPPEKTQELNSLPAKKKNPIDNIPLIDSLHEITETNITVCNTSNSELVRDYKELTNKYQQLEEELKKSSSEVFSLKMELSELYVSEITDFEMEALAPEEFKVFFTSYQGKRRDIIYNFHQKEDDFAWGLDTQTKILDFFNMHYDNTNIQLISAVCKQPHCEILAIEKQEGAWERINKDMYQQSWLKFSSATHTTKYNSDNQLIIHAFYNK